MKNWIYIITTVIISWFCTSCLQNKQKPIWGRVIVQRDLAKKPIYRMLDKQLDDWGPFPNDTPGTKTSDVSYRNNRNRDINNLEFAKINNCKAYLKSDTIVINIGSNSMFSGAGFIINCKKKVFYIEPYYWTDAMIEKPKPTFKWIYQKLTLDKSTYRLNDSLHGHVSFKIVEDDNGQEITHIGDGYFRSQIKQWPH